MPPCWRKINLSLSFFFNLPTLINDIMSYNDRIAAAHADLE